MKKALSILLLVCMIASLCACGATEAAPASSSSSTESSDVSSIAQQVLDNTSEYKQQQEDAEVMSVAGDLPGADKANERYIIGVSMSAYDEDHSQWYASCERTAEELGCDIVYTAADNSVELQLSGIESLIEQECDAILVRAIDADGCVSAGEAITNAGIKLVLSSNNMNVDKFDLAIMSDQYVYAEQQAKYLMSVIEKNPDLVLNVGYLWGITGISQVEERYLGFKENSVDISDNINLIAEDIANWSTNEAMNKVENWIEAYGDDINCVVAMNDTMALGAVEAFKAAGRDLSEVWIVGLDGSAAGIQSVLDGELDCTAYKDIDLDAKIQIRMAVDLLNNPEKYADNNYYLLGDNLFPLSLETYDEIMAMKKN